MPPEIQKTQSLNTCILTEAQTYLPPFSACANGYAVFVTYYSRDKTVPESHRTSEDENTFNVFIHAIEIFNFKSLKHHLCLNKLYDINIDIICQPSINV